MFINYYVIHAEYRCQIHYTRTFRHDLLHEAIHMLGHTQWIWHPFELNLTNYRFIHFYRHPFKKIVSGYRYHLSGAEMWTKRALKFQRLCQYARILRNDSDNNSSMKIGSYNKSDFWKKQVDKNLVFSYCESTYLCETCCRREHEYLPESAQGISSVITFADKDFFARNNFEYDFMCKHLGKIEQSLQHTLQMLPANDGILVEAALDYYENLRMINIMNLTANDPNVLNLDLDFMTKNFKIGVSRILNHLKGLLPRDAIYDLQEELQFYDLKTSPAYRWSMSNPAVNHITSMPNKVNDRSDRLLEQLKNNLEVNKLYSPILELFKSI